MALEIRLDKDRRLEVSKGHFYNKNCKCLACLEHWLGFASGDIVVLSHDGKHRMVPPGSPNGSTTPPQQAM